ncbi:MAG: hypothetical protein LUQ65_04015 [Candidatus Helarchaeota archaeon]|nr:hypothetical protein [Candidatus Helarchaeota archaeon]
MITETNNQLALQVMSDDMYILSQIVSQNGWTDVEEFYQGEMIENPLNCNGWELIPADQYEYSIPPEAVQRVCQLVNAGVQIKGIVIADDPRSRPVKSVKPAKETLQINWKIIWGVLKILGMVMAGVVAVVAVSALAVVIVAAGLGLLVVTALGAALMYDPKLIILISDGEGNTIWVSLYTWYDPPSE